MRFVAAGSGRAIVRVAEPPPSAPPPLSFQGSQRERQRAVSRADSLASVKLYEKWRRGRPSGSVSAYTHLCDGQQVTELLTRPGYNSRVALSLRARLGTATPPRLPGLPVRADRQAGLGSFLRVGPHMTCTCVCMCVLKAAFGLLWWRVKERGWGGASTHCNTTTKNAHLWY